jgi:acetyl esterase/lipase
MSRSIPHHVSISVSPAIALCISTHCSCTYSGAWWSASQTLLSSKTPSASGWTAINYLNRRTIEKAWKDSGSTFQCAKYRYSSVYPDERCLKGLLFRNLVWLATLPRNLKPHPRRFSRTIDVHKYGKCRVCVFLPSKPPPTPRPIVVHVHGGGWTM